MTGTLVLAEPAAPATTRSRLAWGAALAALPFGCLVLALNDPADGGIYPPCPFRTLTGLDCPGCGTGRAMHRLLHGRVGEALDFNALAVLALPFLGYALLSQAVLVATGRRLPRLRPGGALSWLVLGVVMAWVVLRNLPVGPLAWAASYR